MCGRRLRGRSLEDVALDSINMEKYVVKIMSSGTMIDTFFN